MVAYFLVLLLSIFALSYFTRSFDSNELRLIWLSFAIHAVFALGQVVYHTEIFGGGDMMGYHGIGQYVSRLVAEDLRLLPDLFALASKGTDHQFAWIRGTGSSTGVMFGISALMGLVVGDSLVAKCLLFSMISFVGKLALYYGLKLHLPPLFHRRALIASMLMPSVVFWSSGIIKESVTVSGLGLLFYAISHFIKFRRVSFPPLLVMGIGLFVVWISKSYVLVVLAISGSGWIVGDHLRRRGRLRLRPWHFVAIAGVCVVGLLGMGRVFPEYSLAEVAEETANLQDAYRRIDGGSSFQVTRVTAEQGLAGQVVNLPIAFTSTLFRPFVFESRNVAMFLNSLETTAVFGLFMLALYRRGRRQTLQMISNEPFLIFCTIYVFIFAVALGLAAPNLGTLSRYRIPMVPIFWVLVFVLLPPKKPQRPKASKIPR